MKSSLAWPTPRSAKRPTDTRLARSSAGSASAKVEEIRIGRSTERLDFTVVGPAVNETSRIASMCRSVDRPILISSTFADALPDQERTNLVSVGRFALRGVGHAKELFTLDPATL